MNTLDFEWHSLHFDKQVVLNMKPFIVSIMTFTRKDILISKVEGRNQNADI